MKVFLRVTLRLLAAQKRQPPATPPRPHLRLHHRHHGADIVVYHYESIKDGTVTCLPRLKINEQQWVKRSIHILICACTLTPLSFITTMVSHCWQSKQPAILSLLPNDESALISNRRLGHVLHGFLIRPLLGLV